MWNGRKQINCQKAKEGNDDSDRPDIDRIFHLIHRYYYVFIHRKYSMKESLIKDKQQIENLRISGKHLTELLYILHAKAKAGIALIELEFVAEHYIKEHNLKGSFKNYQ